MTEDRAGKVLEWIVRYKTRSDGNSPSLREIQRGLGLSSTSVVYNILHVLQVRGSIRMVPEGTRARSIVVVGGKWVWEPEEVAAC